MQILQRADLIDKYKEILSAGLTPSDFANFEATGRFPAGTIVQSSSGSSGKEIFRIPRSPLDIQDLFRRTLIPYNNVFATPPTRIAMLGGISHMEAAMNFKLKTTTFKSLSLQELDELEKFDPEVISCYPSIGRELIANAQLKLKSLKAFKFGGEPLLEIDLKKCRARFGEIAIVEQVGSTEMPGLAIGVRELNKARRIPLQKERFSFSLRKDNDWQPLVAKDNFPQLLFPIASYYDTEDEVIIDGDYLLSIRRRDDKSFAHLALIESILEAGARNVQIDLCNNQITIEADVLPCVKTDFNMKLGRIQRLTPSNKLALVIGVAHD